MISILMIVYDVEQYLRRAIESVLNQTYKDIELILVVGINDRDNCEDICREYAKKDSRIKLIVAPAKGAPDARNQGLKEVSGDYLGFVDADDYVEPDMFLSMLSNMQKEKADIAVCGRFYEFKNKTLKDPDGVPIVYTGEEAIKVTLSGQGFFLHCWDKLYSRKIFEGLHFRTDIYVEDRIVVDQLLSKADRVVYDSTPKYHFRERSNSMSKKKGVVRKNVEGNEIMQEFILQNHPSIKNECNRFMLYEYITAIQNELTSDEVSKEDIKEYQGKVKELYRENNPLVGKSLKVKSILAMYFSWFLKVYTSKRKKQDKADLVRFL